MTLGGGESVKRRETSRIDMSRRFKGIMAGTVAIGLTMGSAGFEVRAAAVSTNANSHNPQWLVQSLMGSWRPSGADSWHIALAGGGLAVLAIQPG